MVDHCSTIHGFHPISPLSAKLGIYLPTPIKIHIALCLTAFIHEKSLLLKIEAAYSIIVHTIQLNSFGLFTEGITSLVVSTPEMHNHRSFFID